MSIDLTLLANIEAERAVLGACILNEHALIAVADILKPDDFYDTNHRVAYDALMDMYQKDKTVDHITFANDLREKGLFDRLGGQPFINMLAAEVTTTANAEYYAEIVRDRSVRRKLANAGEIISNMATNYDKTIPMIIEDAEKLLFNAGQTKRSEEFMHVRDIIPSTFSNMIAVASGERTAAAGYLTNFVDLDNMTGGLQPGTLTILAARPSMGKTALALNIAQFGGTDNRSVLIFSLEMPATQIVQRMISAESRINLSSLIRGTFSASDFKKVKEACDVIAQRELYINDTTQLSALDFRSRCRLFKKLHPDLALVVIDYLQLMSSDVRPDMNRQQEVSDISRMLKAVAREINCPVLALSQLSRAAEQRTDKKPQLSDLRDSGAIEQDADLVLMLFRQDYYGDNENNELTNSKAEIRVAKNRNGKTGTFYLTFEREITLFCNYGYSTPE